MATQMISKTVKISFTSCNWMKTRMSSNYQNSILSNQWAPAVEISKTRTTAVTSVGWIGPKMTKPILVRFRILAPLTDKLNKIMNCHFNFWFIFYFLIFWLGCGHNKRYWSWSQGLEWYKVINPNRKFDQMSPFSCNNFWSDWSLCISWSISLPPMSSPLRKSCG